jgi:hypothetical protein
LRTADEEIVAAIPGEHHDAPAFQLQSQCARRKRKRR